MLDNILSLAGVHTHIGPYHILQGIDMEIPEGEITVLLGRNGAGKTTTAQTILGLLHPSAGTIFFDGKPIHQLDAPQVVRRGIGYVPEQMNVFLDLTVMENLILAAYDRPRPDEEHLQTIYQLFPPLEKMLQKRAGVLSGRQKQMLSIARAMVLPRRMIIIDEPAKGLAPSIVNSLASSLETMREAGTTVLLIEQNLPFASRVGQHFYVLEDGMVVHNGLIEQLNKDLELQNRLLGLEG